MVQIYGKLTDSMNRFNDLNRFNDHSMQHKCTKRCIPGGVLCKDTNILVGTAVALCATNYTVAATACT